MQVFDRDEGARVFSEDDLFQFGEVEALGRDAKDPDAYGVKVGDVLDGDVSKLPVRAERGRRLRAI
jgi:hypothetical protein